VSVVRLHIPAGGPAGPLPRRARELTTPGLAHLPRRAGHRAGAAGGPVGVQVAAGAHAVGLTPRARGDTAPGLAELPGDARHAAPTAVGAVPAGVRAAPRPAVSAAGGEPRRALGAARPVGAHLPRRAGDVAHAAVAVVGHHTDTHPPTSHLRGGAGDLAATRLAHLPSGAGVVAHPAVDPVPAGVHARPPAAGRVRRARRRAGVRRGVRSAVGPRRRGGRARPPPASAPAPRRSCPPEAVSSSPPQGPERRPPRRRGGAPRRSSLADRRPQPGRASIRLRSSGGTVGAP
jgi:hypothetical protein